MGDEPKSAQEASWCSHGGEAHRSDAWLLRGCDEGKTWADRHAAKLSDRAV